VDIASFETNLMSQLGTIHSLTSADIYKAARWCSPGDATDPEIRLEPRGISAAAGHPGAPRSEYRYRIWFSSDDTTAPIASHHAFVTLTIDAIAGTRGTTAGGLLRIDYEGAAYDVHDSRPEQLVSYVDIVALASDRSST